MEGNQGKWGVDFSPLKVMLSSNLNRGSTVGKVSTDHQYKKFSSTDDEFFCAVGI